MEEKIEDVLVKIGVPANVLGFDFIKEAVLILDRDGVCAKWICLYHEIGKKYGKTGGMVERGIRYALHATRKECKDKDVVNDSQIPAIRTASHFFTEESRERLEG